MKRSRIRSCDSRIETRPGTESSQTPNSFQVLREMGKLLCRFIAHALALKSTEKCQK